MMKKILNKPENYVDEMLDGLVAAHPDIYAEPERRVIARAGGVVKGTWGMGGLSGNMNLSVGIFSLAGEINFAVSSDEAITPDPERILDHFKESVQIVLDRTGAAS